jgi:hypothetical protein
MIAKFFRDLSVRAGNSLKRKLCLLNYFKTSATNPYARAQGEKYFDHTIKDMNRQKQEALIGLLLLPM